MLIPDPQWAGPEPAAPWAICCWGWHPRRAVARLFVQQFLKLSKVWSLWYLLFICFILTFDPLVSMLASTSMYENVLDMRKISNKAPTNIIIIITERGAAGAEEGWWEHPHPEKRSLKDRTKRRWGVLILLSMNMGLKPRFCEPDRPWLHFSISKPLIWVPLSDGLAVTFTSWQVLRKIQQWWKRYSSHKAVVFMPASPVFFPLCLFRVLPFISTSFRNHPWIGSQFTSKHQTESKESPILP